MDSMQHTVSNKVPHPIQRHLPESSSQQATIPTQSMVLLAVAFNVHWCTQSTLICKVTLRLGTTSYYNNVVLGL